MNAGDPATDIVAGEGAVRAALAAHPWPRFGERLQGRLMAIAATPPEASIDAQRDVRRTAADDAAPAAAPRAMRRWRREVWATGAVMAVVAALAVVLAGTARVRQARPVEGPVAQSPTPGAADPALAPSDPLSDRFSGRLIYFEPGQGDGSATLFALDMRTGRDERLWDAPTRSDVHGVVSPDGSRLAIARRPDGDAPGLVYVRHLDPAAPQPLAMAAPDDVGSLIWAPDGAALYYDEILWSAPSGDGAMPSPVGWQLHRLTLRDDVPSLEPRPTVGPLSAGIQSGEDQVIVRLDAAALGSTGSAHIVAIDPDHRRAAVAFGGGEDVRVDGIALFDTATGTAVEGARTPASQIEAFRAVANRTGTKVAYTNCLGCHDGSEPWSYSVRVLTLATGDVSEVWSDPEGSLEKARLLWSPDDRWLVWTTQQYATRIADLSAASPTTHELPESFGHPIAFAPSGARLLLSTGQLLDLNAAPPPEWLPEPLPWAMPAWLAEWNGIGRVIAWAPDFDRSAAAVTAAAASTPAARIAATAGAMDAPGANAAGFAPITPVATVTVSSSVNDVLASPVLDVVAWSPDSRWIPFWTADGSDHYQYWRWPAALNIVDRTNGAVCRVPGVSRTTHADAIFWTDDGQLAVRTAGGVAIGRPCDALEPAPRSTYALPAAPPGVTPGWAEPPPHEWADGAGAEASGPSPDGTLLVKTTATGDAEDHYITTITRVADGNAVVTATWRGNGGLGSMGLGGEWLPNGAFLIHYSVDQGPLLLAPDGSVSAAAATLFDVADGDVEGVADLYSAALKHPDGRTWHAVLNGSGNIRLYHPETRLTETLPSVELWGGGLSADGRWLMLDGRDGEIGAGGGLWIREIDDVSTPFRKIAGSDRTDPYSTALSPDGTRIAFLPRTPAGHIPIASFPDGHVVGRWHLGGYEAGSARWSPDGRSLAIDGYRHDDDGGIAERALFILPLPPEP